MSMIPCLFSLMAIIMGPVLLSRTWDSRTRTRTWAGINTHISCRKSKKSCH